MIEIIKRGTKQHQICRACGCEFTFENKEGNAYLAILIETKA